MYITAELRDIKTLSWLVVIFHNNNRYHRRHSTSSFLYSICFVFIIFVVHAQLDFHNFLSFYTIMFATAPQVFVVKFNISR